MIVQRLIVKAKEVAAGEQYPTLTIDSPIYYDLSSVLSELRQLDTEQVEGARSGTTKAGPYAGKLSRLVARLENKVRDRRLGFLFGSGGNVPGDLAKLAEALLLPASNSPQQCGVKIVNFAEVP